ncbi:chloride channel protein [Paraburkholderia ferrariae]|jgi:H+/Cl- antiporter ClcA|uniref:chloride channel protein n=1 Tax=Paraburkholderia ferrariae TaxID=386056 RepID=UPI000A03F159|nr:chloride channel protein [Paraburkholderia ferrariae]
MSTPRSAASRPPPRSPLATLAVVTVLTGIGAGLGGMLLAMLLHEIQHIAYGYSQAHVISSESFLQGVTGTAPARRVAVLVVCGFVGGFGWWALYRYGRPLVSISAAIKPGGARMPLFATTVHALLQIVTVALGSPLGREVAPREIGAAFATWISKATGLTAAERRVMIACGAGAGLSAVYNVPLGGAVFVLEVLLGTFGWSAAIPALTTSAIAAVVAWIGLGDERQYHVPFYTINAQLVVFSVLCGPFFGAAAHGFSRMTGRARDASPKDWRLPLYSLANFTGIGLLAIWFPQLPGNGKGPAGLSFNDDLGIGLAAALLVLKLLTTTTSLRAGVKGGLLTPGIAIGALFAVVIAGLANHVWAGLEPGAFAIVGAAAFLAASMQMPVTAVVLMLEFTHVNYDLAIPMLLAVAGSVATLRLMAHAQRPPKPRGEASATRANDRAAPATRETLD